MLLNDIRARIRDPIVQAMAHMRSNQYKDFPGEGYVVCRVKRRFCPRHGFDVDYLEIKQGRSTVTERRQHQYKMHCIGIDFIWLYKFQTEQSKLVGESIYCPCYGCLYSERLMHLTLRALGADRSPSLCSCNVRHTEFKDYEAAGGIDGIVDIIQFWRGALGERDLEL